MKNTILSKILCDFVVKEIGNYHNHAKKHPNIQGLNAYEETF